ncbi:MAG: response regulator [Segetibacter sp.]|nr:response regulator [Segetibacter sp.]
MSTEQLDIYLAEDDMDDCIFFKNALMVGALNIKLTIANNGEELMSLLTLAKNKLPHVLFLDLNMPRKNGFECLAEIRLNKDLRNLPVIVFSTSFEREVVNKLHADGAQYFIRKPSNFDHFVSIILRSLDLIKNNASIQPLLADFVIEDVV